MRPIAAIACISVWTLVGCATPAGQFRESDAEWSTAELSLNYQAAYRNVHTGFRKCGMIAEGSLYSDTKEGNFDIYLPDMLGGRSPWVFGFVRIKSVDDQTSTVSVGVNKIYDAPLIGKRGAARKRILGWASGGADCDN